MNERPGCPVCELFPLADKVEGTWTLFACQRCGKFQLTATALKELSEVTDDRRRMLLSGDIRRSFEDGTSLELDSYKLKALLEQEEPPRRSLFDHVDQFLLYLAERATRPFKKVTYYMVHDFTLLGFTSEDEMNDAATAARELEYLTPNAERITLDGWRRVEELRSRRPDSRKAFVAMWFDDKMEAAWTDGFEPGIRDTEFFEPVRVLDIEHSGKIDNLIVAQIRTSGLLVADFTGNRGSVYFEAGFAAGLGVPVVWCCRKDYFDDHGVQFDTQQYNHILWTDPSDLREKLKNRILAEVPASTNALP